MSVVYRFFADVTLIFVNYFALQYVYWIFTFVYVLFIDKETLFEYNILYPLLCPVGITNMNGW